MNTNKDSTTTSAPATAYAAMSVWDLWRIMETTVAARRFFDLSQCSEAAGETPAFLWAVAWEARLDADLLAMSASMAGRLNLDRDDEDIRDMAFKRIDGLVPVHVWDTSPIHMEAAQ